jgi:glycerophosphoryl diester phosphodiesterase
MAACGVSPHSGGEKERMNALRKRLLALGRPMVVAHRGASRAAPENSLRALALARELGADGVEFDVQRCASGELVVFHDATLARCTGALGSVTETSLATLRTLRLGRLPGGAGEVVPTLDAWLDAAPRELFLNLEVKADVLAQTVIGGPCAEALVQAGRAEGALVSAFHPASLVHARRAAPELARGALVDDGGHWRLMTALGLATRPAAVHPFHALATPARVAAWHRLGLLVAVWTVDAPEALHGVLAAGVDVVITNRPDVARPIAETYRR